MKKIIAIIILAITPINVSAAVGWTTASKITSLGQYGVNQMTILFEEDVSVCSNKKRLIYDVLDASQPESFYSTLLSAYLSGKKVRIYLHDPVSCGSLNGQKIINPDYIFIQD